LTFLQRKRYNCKKGMYSRKFYSGILLILTFGILSAAASFPAAKDNKDKKAPDEELIRVKEENVRIKQEIDDLNAKFDLLITRLDQMEKTIAELKSQNLAAKKPEQIKEENLVAKEPAPNDTNKDNAHNLPVVKMEPAPEKPSPPQTKKVISFGDDKNNPNNPKILIKEEAGKAPAKPADKNKVTELKIPESPRAEAEPLSDSEIKKLVDEKNYSKAEAAVKERLNSDPSEKEACVLYISLAEIRAKSGNSAGSAGAYLELADHHPTCDQAPEAMFKAGEIYQKTDKNKSKKIFEELISLYPYSNYANLAEEKLKK